MTEARVVTDQPFDVWIEAVWSGGPTEVFDFELTIELGIFMGPDGVPLEYVPGSFVPTSWVWGGGWDFVIDVDLGGERLTITSSSPTVPWGHWVNDGESLPFGTMQFQANQLNAKDYDTGVRTPWELSAATPPASNLFTSDDLSTWIMVSGPPVLLDVFTDGQRDLLPPVPAFGTSATRFAVSVGGKASVENTQFTGSGPISETDDEDKWFEAAQAYRTTELPTNTYMDSYAWSSYAAQDWNGVFSLEANATLDASLAHFDPSAPFTAHGRAEITSGNRLVMLAGTGGAYPNGTPMAVTVSAGLWSQATPLGPTGEEGVVDWMCTVRLDAAAGPLLGTLVPGTETIAFTAPIGSSLYFEGYLDATATSSYWILHPELGLYSAAGAEALSMLDLWTHTEPLLVPGDMDCDGGVDIAGDLPLFVDAVLDPAGYAPPPGCSIDPADMNGDTEYDGLDVQGFVAALIP